MTITRTTIRTALAGAVAISVLTTCAGGRSQPPPTSRPDLVTRSCHLPANDRACSVALRYLAALDLDRTHAACILLERSTLTAAGGLKGCTKTLMASRGIRIHYAVSAVLTVPTRSHHPLLDLGRGTRARPSGDGGLACRLDRGGRAGALTSVDPLAAVAAHPPRGDQGDGAWPPRAPAPKRPPLPLSPTRAHARRVTRPDGSHPLAVIMVVGARSLRPSRSRGVEARRERSSLFLTYPSREPPEAPSSLGSLDWRYLGRCGAW